MTTAAGGSEKGARAVAATPASGDAPRLGDVKCLRSPRACILAQPIGCRLPVHSAVTVLGRVASAASSASTPGSTSRPSPMPPTLASVKAIMLAARRGSRGAASTMLMPLWRMQASATRGSVLPWCSTAAEGR